MRIAVVSTFPPRRCGIATFSADLVDSLVQVEGVDRVDVAALTLDDESYPSPVVSTIRHDVRDDYVRAARLLPRLGIDVVVVQHEYGIYGGADGEHLLALVGELTIPFVVTLHTVLTTPTRSQATVLRELCRRAAAVLVFTETAARLVTTSATADALRVHVVPHGAPQSICDVAVADLDEHSTADFEGRDADAAAGRRFIVSSFGLLSPGKGIEVVIDALAKVAPSHPEVQLVVAGRTHPEVAKRHGERYREDLRRRVAELDLADHVVFDDHFLRIDELAALLAKTDLYVTAYPSVDQIVSGSLTFAVAAGRPVVSTPYLYATELLGSGAGRLVPFADPAALAAAIIELIEDPNALARHRASARSAGAGLRWPAVAARTAEILAASIGRTRVDTRTATPERR